MMNLENIMTPCRPEQKTVSVTKSISVRYRFTCHAPDMN